MNANARVASSVLDVVGRTPLVELRRLFHHEPFRVFAKLELLNPGGSSKDRPALRILRQGIERGEIRPGRTVVIESTSGNMGVGLAQACAYLGVDLVCVVDRRATTQNLAILRAFGARIELVHESDGAPDLLTARLNKVNELLDEFDDAFWPNQYNNPDNSRAYYDAMRDMLAELGRVDFLFCATSTCGTIRGCAEYIADNGLSTIVCGVDAAGSVVLGGELGERLLPGHGASVQPGLYDRSLIDRAIKVTDLECVTACRELVSTEAILAGGSSGAVIRAVQRQAPEIPPDSTCVAILPDRGERYLDTIYDDRWVIENLLGARGDGSLAHRDDSGARPLVVGGVR